MRDIKIYIEDNIEKSEEDITKEILTEVVKISEPFQINIDALIISLPPYRTVINEDIFESELGDIDIFITNSMVENNKSDEITVIIKEKGIYQIALDGPSASGKSTIAKLLAGILGIKYLDTGSMYRAITHYLLTNKIDLNNEEEISTSLNNITIAYLNNDIELNGEVITNELRTDVINKNVSLVSSYLSVREKLVNIQQEISKIDSIILDGRDIGTVVLPEAKYKFFLIASAEERAKRRLGDENSKSRYTYDEVLEDIKRRDHLDSTRAISPLKKAEDAIEIDSTNMSINEVVETILKYVRGIM